MPVRAMRPHRLPRPLRLSLFLLATGVLLYLCLAPQSDLPQTHTWDKLQHAVAWFVLTVIGLTLSPRRRLAVPGFALALGAGIEILQALMGFGRNGDWRDFVFDALGVALGVAVTWRLTWGARASST